MARESFMGRVPYDYEFKAGEVLVDRYRIDRPRGHGGMGEVYEATDLYLEKKVALKTIKPTDSEGLPRPWQAYEARFRMEAQIGVRLRDPRSFHDGRDRLVTILDCHLMADGRPIALMDLFSGLTLANYLEKHGRVKFSTACQIARDVCAGLAFAHEHDVLHRDIKPQNIMLEPGAQLRAYITDFGVGKVLTPGETMLTCEGSPVGTPGWIPREQLLGIAPPSPATDMFAVGLLIFLMITGKGAFSHLGGDALRLLVTNAPPIAPMFTEFLSEYGEAERALALQVARCLSHSPNERPDASTMAAACARAERSARGRDGEAYVDATIEDESNQITSMIVEGLSAGSAAGVSRTRPDAGRRLPLGSLPTEVNSQPGPPPTLAPPERAAMRAADRARHAESSKLPAKSARSEPIAPSMTVPFPPPPTASLPHANHTPSSMSRTMDPALERQHVAHEAAAVAVLEQASAPPSAPGPQKRVLAIAGLGSMLGVLLLVGAGMFAYRYGTARAPAPSPAMPAVAAESSAVVPSAAAPSAATSATANPPAASASSRTVIADAAKVPALAKP
ncbi:serine/threonine protein kinase [Pendulispora rubella]|uniref:Serine/threonine protein kinase n=1 Tax=Pendulispora rubella TaxID=2741070 RepID=A0ABZ2LF76_9BACT